MTHTQNGKAKCLGYGIRSAGRCGRKATFEVEYTDRTGMHHLSLCEECARIAVETRAGRIIQESAGGFTVKSGDNASNCVAREYRSIK